MIAACGFETWAPGVGEHSFTRSLIDELKYWSRNHSLSVAMLHNKVLSRIKYWKPRFGRTGEHEHRKTPIYIVLFNEKKNRSIELRPLPSQACPLSEMPAELGHGTLSTSSSSSIGTQGIVNDNALGSSQSSIVRLTSDSDTDGPRVLVSLALEEDQWLHSDEWSEWLQSVPALVKHARIEGIYKGGSTLMLLSLQIAVWDLLPEDPALTFIGLIRSGNLIGRRPRSTVTSQDAAQKKDLVASREGEVEGIQQGQFPPHLTSTGLRNITGSPPSRPLPKPPSGPLALNTASNPSYPFNELLNYTTVFLIDDFANEPDLLVEVVHLLKTLDDQRQAFGRFAMVRIELVNPHDQTRKIFLEHFSDERIFTRAKSVHQYLSDLLNAFMLDQLSLDKQERQNQRGLNIIVISSPVSKWPYVGMKDLIPAMVDRLDILEVPKGKIGINFILLSNNPSALEDLKSTGGEMLDKSDRRVSVQILYIW